ncbi:MAG TPA: SIS domain-containing protein [Clostridiaceae bacterium]|nr:SIS domain-containing protein [Clostridiaceae bacterium]
MKKSVSEIFNRLFLNYPELVVCKEDIINTFNALVQCYEKGGKVLICGNGGSAADSEHIVGELMKGFILKREIPFEDKEKIKAAFPEDADYLAGNLQRALPAISLISQTSLSTAFINDMAADMVYAQQVYGYGQKGDVLIGISTSGNAYNVVNAVKIAKAFGIKTIGITGESGGMLKDLCDLTIKVPAKETFRIQEYHLPVYHALCAALEEEFFGRE